jgi:hypothetical protein
MKAISVFILCVAAFPAFCQDNEGFVLVKSEPPIELHERWVEFPGKIPAVTSRELKTVFTVNTSIDKLISLIKDESQVKTWQGNIRAYKIYLKPDDNSVWEEYSCHAIPWPLDDQDSFMEYKLSEIIPGKEYIVNFKSLTDTKVAPVKDNINRIELVGSWRFSQTSPGVVSVIYRIQSAPATNVPRMIVDPVVRNNIVASIKSLTEIAEK